MRDWNRKAKYSEILSCWMQYTVMNFTVLRNGGIGWTATKERKEKQEQRTENWLILYFHAGIGIQWVNDMRLQLESPKSTMWRNIYILYLATKSCHLKIYVLDSYIVDNQLLKPRIQLWQCSARYYPGQLIYFFIARESSILLTMTG